MRFATRAGVAAAPSLAIVDVNEKDYSVVTGYARIEGRPVCVFSQDFTVVGGSVSEVAAEKVCKIMDMAMKTGVPIIGINDGGGARIQEGVSSLKGYGEIFRRNVQASGVVPQISVILGPAAGGAVYSPSITDFVFMVEGHSFMFITGPDIVHAVTMEEVTDEELGGARIHATRSGVAHFAIDGEEACLREVRRLVAFLPLNNLDDPPIVEMGDDPRRRDEDMLTVLPENDYSLPAGRGAAFLRRLLRIFSTGRLLLVLTLIVAGYFFVSAADSFVASSRISEDEAQLRQQIAALE